MAKSWTLNNIEGMDYQNFEVSPLKAISIPTQKRMDQLFEDLNCVKSKSVLDIGCFAGLASLVALKCGASKVISTDVNAKYLNYINAYAVENGLPLRTEEVDFNGLTKDHCSDVVLLLEVYHWLAHQGLKPDFVATKLNMLANQYIIIESPFDRTDPSVLRSLGENSNFYRLDLLLNSLIDMGWSVNFSGLTSYFPSEYNRARFIARKN